MSQNTVKNLSRQSMGLKKQQIVLTRRAVHTQGTLGTQGKNDWNTVFGNWQSLSVLGRNTVYTGKF